MAATTVGAGLFALPYVFMRAGWLFGAGYLALLGGATIFTHALYFRALAHAESGVTLLGLVRKKLGSAWHMLGLAVILGGLLLALVAYLILAEKFSELIFPGMGIWGMLLFWACASIPVLFGLRRMVFVELAAGGLMIAAIIFIFLSSLGDQVSREIPVADFAYGFLPFGAVLFALTGWTAVEPIFAAHARLGNGKHSAFTGMGWGTASAALLYLLFALGIISSASVITPDTLGGIGGWPFWKFGVMLVLGFFAILTSYIPIALEVKNTLVRDLRVPRVAGMYAVFLVPPLIFFLGLRDFLEVVGLAGSVFLGLEYVLILLVSGRILELRGTKRGILILLTALFALAAVYEIYTFVVQ